MDSAINAIKEEQLQMEETDDSCRLEYFEIVPLTRDTNHTDTQEYATPDGSAEVKQENLAVVKQEPEDVCCFTYVCSVIYTVLSIPVL